MSMTYDDYARDMALVELHHEAVMERAKWEQCIYLFVEGESEQIAFPVLLGEFIDLEDLGIVIAVYNGNGNLYTALKLLSQTLSHDRPVVATYDNDLDGVRAVRRYEQSDFVSDRVHFFAIPNSPVVEFSDGHRGGSFEESFEPGDFLDVCFSTEIVTEEISRQRQVFERQFEPGKPWLPQVRKFCAERDFTKWTARKPKLAENLAWNCSSIPDTYKELAAIIQDVREKYPVRDPNDAQLPKVHGLTDWPENDKAQPSAPADGGSASSPTAAEP